MRLYGVTSKTTISDWVALGMPKLATNKYDLFAIHAWKTERDETGNEVATDSKEKYWKYHAELEEIKVGKAKEDLIPRSDILPEWCARVGELTQSLEGMAIKLPPLLEGKNQKQMHKILYDEVGLMRDSYARTGKYTPSCSVAKPKKKVTRKKPAKKKTTKK